MGAYLITGVSPLSTLPFDFCHAPLSRRLYLPQMLKPFTLLLRATMCYDIEDTTCSHLCEYVCQRGQQGVKRCERVSGLDCRRSNSYTFCSWQNYECVNVIVGCH